MSLKLDRIANGFFFFFRATYNGNLQQLKRLCKHMDKGRLAKLKTNYGQGLLHVAAHKGWTNICKYFIEDLNFNVDEKDTEGKTPLFGASSEGHLRTILYLIEKGADPAALDQYKTNALHCAASKGLYLSFSYKNSMFCGSDSFFYLYLQILHFLFVIYFGQTKLRLSNIRGHTEIVSLLLSKGIDVNALCDIGTPIQMAAMCYKPDVLKLLLDHGANAGADPNGITCGKPPLVCAAKAGKLNIIKGLLEAGADPNITSIILTIPVTYQFGMKPIEVAALNKKHPEVRILFPVTSPIPACSDWSITGIMKHVHSEEAKQQALQSDCSDATVYSNKSLCSAYLGLGEVAWSLAKVFIMLRPDWPEAYNRAGVALSLRKKYDMAADAFCMGSKLDPEDKELQDGFRKAVEAKMNSVRI
ncbi:hypothetical protein AQUCO_01700622v1 [Aquilegia coerulea]|uniref:Uncharacterized protein n=1 Tax=Aquilegia coerulea TaxID=218851 RepID=A0A2G5DP32_AQUCA|nr:hypothetical protein AQUCO_01700622v1 [Aquilegia coerulea]